MNRRKALSTARKVAIGAVTVVIVGGVAYFVGAQSAAGGTVTVTAPAQTQTTTQTLTAPATAVTRTETITVAQTVREVETAPGQTVTQTVQRTITAQQEVTTPESRALKRAKELAAQLPAGTKLTILIWPPYEDAIKWAIPEWEKETGIGVEFSEVPLEELKAKAIAEAVTRTGRFDLITYTTADIADLVDAGVFLPLNDYMDRYEPELFTGDCPYAGESIVRMNGMVGDKWYGFLFDADVFAGLHIRRDLIEAEKDEVEAKLGYPIRLDDPFWPDTWDELKILAEHFHRPDEELYGIFMYRARFWQLFSFNELFFMAGGKWFDEEMNAALNSPEGVRAVEVIDSLQPYNHPLGLTGDWQPQYTDFPAGKIFMTSAWPSLGRLSNDARFSAVAGKVRSSVGPGLWTKGRLVRAATTAANYSFGVSSTSKNPELAYLFGQWYTGPTNGNITASQGSVADPFRACSFTNPAPGPAIMPEFQRGATLEMFKVAVPFLNILNASEYTDALDRNLNEHAVGGISAQAALDRTAEEWNAITARLGKERQLRSWKTARSQYPKIIRDLHGW